MRGVGLVEFFDFAADVFDECVAGDFVGDETVAELVDEGLHLLAFLIGWAPSVGAFDVVHHWLPPSSAMRLNM